ncbi:hypothetical protein [Burkholderia pseudomallei]|jgi:hypothetical protein|uniref:hypothetical protein n=1 Tax=Burkholderia pseudomallei TaxID=28450 RepID=UPI0024DFA2F3|nr:hypothetical protein [Burkholderia pseudomallei]
MFIDSSGYTIDYWFDDLVEGSDLCAIRTGLPWAPLSSEWRVSEVFNELDGQYKAFIIAVDDSDKRIINSSELWHFSLYVGKDND